MHAGSDVEELEPVDTDEDLGSDGGGSAAAAAKPRRNTTNNDDDKNEDGDGEGDGDGDGDDEDDEPPPPMYADSGSDAGPSSPRTSKRNVKRATSTRAHSSSAAGEKPYGATAGGSSKVKHAAGGKGSKPAAAAGSAVKGAAGAGSAGGGVSEPAIWKAFATSWSGDDYDRLGIVALKKWEAFEKGTTIPQTFRTWYTNQVGCVVVVRSSVRVCIV